MDLKDFDYDLPRELIAQYPLKVREQARLMVIDRKSATIHHDIFSNIGEYLPPGACLVLNDSKVIPARLIGAREKTGGRVEIFLLNKTSSPGCFEAMISPLNKLRLDERIVFEGSSLTAEILDKDRRIVGFNKKNIEKELAKVGHMPLPPYIKRPDEKSDRKDYQTVYARKAGSIASPTAGLHFSKSLLARLKNEGHILEKVTLHVNRATFKSVKENDITKHKMHFESFEVTTTAFKAILGSRKKGKGIIAVGTTSCRVLETIGEPVHPPRLNEFIHPRGVGRSETDIFIYPGYRFKMTDALITNFHWPRSTLLMLVYAFGGTELMRRAYKEAIEKKYRFYSYGDGMLIL